MAPKPQPLASMTSGDTCSSELNNSIYVSYVGMPLTQGKSATGAAVASELFQQWGSVCCPDNQLSR